MTTFIAPTIDWGALTPLLIVLGAAVLGVVLETFVPARTRRVAGLFLAVFAVAGALVAVVWRWTVVWQGGASAAPNYAIAPVRSGAQTPNGLLPEDPFGLAAQGILLVVALVALLVIADRTQTREGSFAAQVASRPGSLDEADADRLGLEQTEIFPLTLFALGGMMVFPVANDLLTLFIALELLSLPLYLLSATARRRRLLSQEAAAKYFVLGAFASAFFLMGIALLYGYSGSLRMAEIAVAVPTVAGMDWLLLAGVTLVLVGLLFKVGAVPFHAWMPDVYQGAPTPITGFMAAATKLAAFAAMVRFLYTAASGLQSYLLPALTVIIILTMLVGTVVGLVQSDIKRLLAYSSVAHAGFILIGVLSWQSLGVSSVLFYLFAYGLATVGAFALVTLVREHDEHGTVTGEATSLDRWKGIGRRRPMVGVAMTVFLLSFADIPLTAGFEGKFAVFSAGLSTGEPVLVVLVVLAVLASAATAFFYFRIIVLMFFDEPTEQSAVAVSSEGLTTVAVVLCVVGTIALGVFPGPVLGLLESAAVFLP